MTRRRPGIVMPPIEISRPVGNLPGASEIACFDDLEQAAASLKSIAIFGEPRWRLALAGDAASSIHLAIRAILHDDERLRQHRDLVLLALWRCAADGDVAARVVFTWLSVRGGANRLHPLDE